MNQHTNKPVQKMFTSQQALDRVKEHNEQRALETAEAFRMTLGSVHGRRVLAHLIHTLANAGGGTFQGNGPHSFFNEGRRSVGVELESNCKTASRDLHKMLVLEQLEREAEDARQQELARKADELTRDEREND